MDTLNPKLFEYNEGSYILKQDVKQALKQIASAFLTELSDSGIPVIPADIRLLGSNAGFDYTPHSDIDLHIVVDFEGVAACKEVLAACFAAEKALFNQNHDITVKGIPVELYVEDVKAGTDSEGIYSLQFDKWIKMPSPYAGVVDDTEAQQLLPRWQSIITAAIARNDYDDIQKTINRLYMIRKTGLETGGRFSTGNLLFKLIRNEGLLDELKAARDAALSSKLSLESLVKPARNTIII